MKVFLLGLFSLPSVVVFNMLSQSSAAERERLGGTRQQRKDIVEARSDQSNFNGNYFIGTQNCVSPDWDRYRLSPYASHDYSESGYDMLAEFRAAVVESGLNHFKFKLSPNVCESYQLSCDSNDINSLEELSQVPEVAATFADPNLKWYHIWGYSFNLPKKLKEDFTDNQMDAEYDEIYDWAKHMLQTYRNTGKVFFLGNWEGDWELMGVSNCRSDGKYDFSCAPTDAIVEKYIKMTSTRQAAINAAKADYGTQGVNIFFYIEFNLAKENYDAHPTEPGSPRPTILNSVVPAVNPDFLSYSSYKSTNKYMDHTGQWFDQQAADERFWSLLDYAKSKLSSTDTDLSMVLGDTTRRIFIGEFSPVNTRDPSLFAPSAAQVFRASLEWGCPFVLHWASYDNYSSTVPLFPRDSQDLYTASPLRQLFIDYTQAAKSYVANNDPTPDELRSWAVEWFRSKY